MLEPVDYCVVYDEMILYCLMMLVQLQTEIWEVEGGVESPLDGVLCSDDVIDERPLCERGGTTGGITPGWERQIFVT